MWRFAFFLILAVPAAAQGVSAQMASIAKQRASIQKQRAVVPVKSTPMPVVFQPAVIKSRCAGMEPAELDRLIVLAAAAHQVSSRLVREVARQESAFKPCAVSSQGAEGLMQLMPATQASLGVEDPFDPAESLMAGARLLRELLQRYNGNVPRALSAYNAGPKPVDRVKGIPRIPETRAYVAKIMSRLTAPDVSRATPPRDSLDGARKYGRRDSL